MEVLSTPFMAPFAANEMDTNKRKEVEICENKKSVFTVCSMEVGW